MSKVEIKSDKYITSVLLNGTDISKTLSGLDLRIEAGRYPQIVLHSIPVPALKLVLNDESVKSSPESFQIAAEILRTEFMQKGDWYNALVASIYRYLQETDGSIPYDQMAEELAVRIVGIEPEEDKDTIDNLDLTVRTYNRLKRAGINTVSQLRNTYTENLREIEDLNQQSIDEIAEKMEKYEF